MCGYMQVYQIAPMDIGVNLDKKSGGALTMASAEREPITGSGTEPPAGFRSRAPGQESGGEAP